MFTRFEITTRLPDDARKEDERQEERRVRDLRARGKADRVAVGVILGSDRVLARNWVRAAYFYVRFEIPRRQFLRGVPSA